MFANEYLRNVFVTIADMSANPNKEWSVKTVPIKLEWFFDDYFSNEISGSLIHNLSAQKLWQLT